MSNVTATTDDLTAAYRLLLGRNPDPAGYDHYVALMQEKSLTTTELSGNFMRSDEYCEKKFSGKVIELSGGGRVVVDPTEPEFGSAIVASSAWEPHIMKLIRSSLSPGQTYVDVGANVGVMAFAAARVVGPLGKVIAFEPNEANAQFFLRGITLNEVQSFVKVYQLALSDQQSIFSLRGGSNSFIDRSQRVGRLIQSIPGDEILAHQPAIHFIKIDIEGHEPLALRGLVETIRRHRPTILCEFNPRCLRDHAGFAPEAFAEQIFQMAHEVQVIEHDGKAIFVSNPGELMGMWATKNADAVKRGMLRDGMLHFDLLFPCDYASRA